MTSATMQPLRYRGQASSYVDIAVRGSDEHLGIGLQYAAHSSGVGCLIVRFVAHGTVIPAKFTHFSYREKARFLTKSDGHAEMFKGIRLNKAVIKLFSPAVGPWEIDKFATLFGVWPMLAEWVTEQVQAEGFTVTVDLQKELKAQLVPEPTTVEVKSAIEFPNLGAVEQKAAFLANTANDSESGDEDDEDEDKAEWLQ
jgi:hypothetical protein